MVSEQGASSRKVVIDAGAAIKLQRLDRFGGELFTTGGVYNEIRDENARALLKTLPQELRVREPLPQDILFTKQFAKATGDLGFLSQNDIELIALTIALHREEGGSVKERPAAIQALEGGCAFDWAPANASKAAEGADEAEAAKDEAEGASKEATPSTPAAAPAQPPKAPTPAPWAKPAGPPTRAPWAKDAAAPAAAFKMPTFGYAAHLAHLHIEPAAPAPEETSTSTAAAAAADEVAAVAHFAEASGKASVAEVLAAVHAIEEEAEAEAAAPPAAADSTAEASTAAEEAGSEEESEDDEEASDSEDGSSAGEWVTQENMHRFGLGVEADAEVRATCATADYSVQNVLLQMGITPLTFDGFAVRSVKLWGLVCRACFHFTRDTQKVFCAKCGHDTVVRVPIIVDQDGQVKMLNSGRPLRKKGTIYSVPKTKGGRAWKPIYAEDEVMLGGRDRQLRHAEKVRDQERQARDPFNEDYNRAWYQRGKGTSGGPGDLPRMRAGLGRANPNANNYKHKNGKKR